jgi:TolA-binding protein
MRLTTDKISNSQCIILKLTSIGLVPSYKMDKILITFLLTFTALLKNVESTSLEANKFEELVVYITSLESKLNNFERKLSVVENQLEVQIYINQKQEKELQTHKAQIESLKTDNGQLKRKSKCLRNNMSI